MMSSLTTFQAVPQTRPIGALKTIISSNTEVDDTWIPVNAVYLQQDYPDLFNYLGTIDAYYFTLSSTLVDDVHAVHYGDQFVSMVGGRLNYITTNHILTSSDGINWARLASPLPAQTFYSVAYSSEYGYVAVGTGGSVMTGTAGGSSWVPRTSGVAVQLNSVAHTPIGFIAGGVSGAMRRSIDGITWIGVPSSTLSDITCVKYLNNRWIFLTSSGQIAVSQDGGIWIPQSISNVRLNDIEYNGANYLVVGDGGVIISSADLTTWSTVSSGVAQNITGISWWTNEYAIVGSSGLYATSQDGLTWSVKGTQVAGNITSIVKGSGPASDITVIGGSRFIGYTTDFLQLASPLYDPLIEFIVPDVSTGNVVMDSTGLQRDGKTSTTNISTFIKARL
jgi:photosystem II stability/assembly factor-like uncharacterized protein